LILKTILLPRLSVAQAGREPVAPLSQEIGKAFARAALTQATVLT
jgi:hypothetical protein